MKWKIPLDDSLTAVLRQLGAQKHTTAEEVASSLLGATLCSAFGLRGRGQGDGRCGPQTLAAEKERKAYEKSHRRQSARSSPPAVPVDTREGLKAKFTQWQTTLQRQAELADKLEASKKLENRPARRYRNRRL